LPIEKSQSEGKLRSWIRSKISILSNLLL